MWAFLNRVAGVMPKICGWGIVSALVAIVIAPAASQWWGGYSGFFDSILGAVVSLFYTAIPAVLLGFSFGVAAALLGWAVHEVLIRKGFRRKIAATTGALVVPLLAVWPGTILLTIAGCFPAVAALSAIAASLFNFAMDRRVLLQSSFRNVQSSL